LKLKIVEDDFLDYKKKNNGSKMTMWTLVLLCRYGLNLLTVHIQLAVVFKCSDGDIS